MTSSCSSMIPSRARSAGCPPASTRPSRRTTAAATAAGLQNTTASPVRIFPAPCAVSAVRSPSRTGRRSGDRRSATRTATIPHLPDRQATRQPRHRQQRETKRQGTKARGTPGTRRGVSNHFSYRESLLKPATAGQKPPRVSHPRARPPQIRLRTVASSWFSRKPAKRIIYMALGLAVPGVPHLRYRWSRPRLSVLASSGSIFWRF